MAKFWGNQMFDTNPFAELSVLLSPTIIQTYIIIMLLLVVGGTIFDVLHKKSAKYFFQAGEKAKKNATRSVDGGEKLSLALKTIGSEVLTSSEFCNPNRRIAHLLGMYGFIIYIVTTIMMVFWYTTSAETPAILPTLWTLGALMICIGGYWFWFFIRVDVSAEGHSPFRIVRADLFILSLVLSATFGLIWAFLQTTGYSFGTYFFLVLYIIASTVLFGTVPWSKFAHMFFKPAAAFQKRVEKADGSMNNMPAPADKPEIFGLGIKRLPPRNY